MTTFDLNFAADHFALFGLPRVQTLDLESLESSYRAVQSKVHPDKHAHAGDSDRRLAMQWATRINEAYRTLKNPLSRAQYVLLLKGVDTATESNTAMPPAFLMEQMEWREAVQEARAGEDVDELDKLLARLRHQHAGVVGEIERDIDRTRDYHAAAAAVRRLMFLEKLQHDILDAIESLET